MIMMKTILLIIVITIIIFCLLNLEWKTPRLSISLAFDDRISYSLILFMPSLTAC